MGSQRVRHDWETELNWKDNLNQIYSQIMSMCLLVEMTPQCPAHDKGRVWFFLLKKRCILMSLNKDRFMLLFHNHFLHLVFPGSMQFPFFSLLKNKIVKLEVYNSLIMWFGVITIISNKLLTLSLIFSFSLCHLGEPQQRLSIYFSALFSYCLCISIAQG